MPFDKETAARLESLYQQHLDEAFTGTLKFDPITVERTQNMFGQEAFLLTVPYDGDIRLLDPAKLNRISSQMIDKATELGIENTIIESYVLSLEYTHGMALIEEPLDEISGNQEWHGLLDLARRLLDTGSAPTQAELNTAVDRSYFAMYHALCHNNTQALAAGLRDRRPDDWSKVYMGMDERTITPRLRPYRPQAYDEVNDFGAAFAILQEHRDRAMEGPGSSFHPSEVARLIQRAQSAILALQSVNAEERRSLAINLLVGKAPGSNRNISTAQDAGMISTG